jgi:hypothetical protein
MICVKTPEPNISSFGPFNITRANQIILISSRSNLADIGHNINNKQNVKKILSIIILIFLNFSKAGIFLLFARS